MNKRIILIFSVLVVIGASVLLAMQLNAATRVSNADAETFARANQLYANGKYDAAANLYQQLLANGIENAEVYYNLGATYAAMGNVNQAEEMYARARELNPRNAQIAQTAHTSTIPLTQNEVALLGLAIVGFGALAFVLVRPRVLFKNQANV